MDKLKPLLTHKFWILFGLALLVPLVGWWMASGAWATSTDDRWTKLDGTNAPPTTDVPNQTWLDGMAGVNAAKQYLLTESGETLWEQQDAQRKWPTFIARDVKDIPPGGEIPPTVRERYRRQYFNELERILATVDPILNVVYENVIPKGERLVMLPPEEDKLPRVPQAEFQTTLPSSERMWEAQEDLWLLESVLQAVADVNEGATKASEVPVRQIYSLTFHGGSRQPAGPATDPNMMGGAAGMPMDAGGEMPGGFGGGAGFGGFGGDGQAGQGQAVSIIPDPKDVFGPDTLALAAGADGSTPGTMPEAGAGLPGGGMMGMGGFGGAGGAQQPGRRYVDDDPAMPFKTRGFILSVAMDHRKVPQLLGDLAAIEWPVTILLVNQQAHNPDLISDSQQQGGGGFGGGMGGGFGGGMPGGFGGGFGSRTTTRPNPLMNRFNGAMGIPGMGGARQGNLTGPLDEELERILVGHERAMRDEYTADVVIAGLLTIYTPPKDPNAATDPNAAAAQPGAPLPPATTEPQPGTTEPPAVGPDGAAAPVPTGEPPAEGTAPTPPKTEPQATPDGTPPQTPPMADPAASPPDAQPPAAAEPPAPMTTDTPPDAAPTTP